MKMLKKKSKQTEEQTEPEEILLQATPTTSYYLLEKMDLIKNELSLINKEIRNLTKVFALANDIELENEDN